MMSVFTIKWHLMFRSLAEESAQFRILNPSVRKQPRAIKPEAMNCLKDEIHIRFCQLSSDVYTFNENLSDLQFYYPVSTRFFSAQ